MGANCGRTTEPSTDELPAETRVGRSALRVADLEEVTAFYRDVVGLQVLDRATETATLGAGGTALLVLEADTEAGARTGPGLYHNAFRVPSQAALGDVLGRVRERLAERGRSFTDTDGGIAVADPDGIEVQLRAE